MNRLFSTVAAALKGTDTSRATPHTRRARLGVEALEARAVMSTTPITDMTQWAQQFAPSGHAQMLWLNFDGKHNDGQSISAFTARSSQDRDASIQDITYRVSEIFSPFNVQVRRMTGDGNYLKTNGDTTIFVGGDLANLVVKGSTFSKSVSGSTPAGYADYANPYRGLDHAPNSDAFDLAYIDPMQWQGNPSDPRAKDPANWTNVWSEAQIAYGIAHEAGHTFGLAHVLSSSTPDAMNYGSAGFQYFINQTLPITTNNYNSQTGVTAPDANLQPLSHFDVDVGFFKFETPVNMTTQNSFTYLQTVLGKRASDGFVHASDPNSVDPSSTNTRPDYFIGTGFSSSAATTGGDGGTHATLARTGDYDAFKLRATGSLQYHINVMPDLTTLLRPNLMVKDSSGNVLFFNHSDSSNTNAHIDFLATAGQIYTIVVGSQDTYGSGGFKIAVSSNSPVPDLTGATFTFAPPTNSGLQLGRLDIQSEDLNTGTFRGVYRDYLGISIAVTGTVANTSSNTSDFSFSGSTYTNLLAVAQFSGKLTGTGRASGTGWSDSLTGTIVDQVFQLPNMNTLWAWVAPVIGKDF